MYRRLRTGKGMMDELHDYFTTKELPNKVRLAVAAALTCAALFTVLT